MIFDLDEKYNVNLHVVGIMFSIFLSFILYFDTVIILNIIGKIQSQNIEIKNHFDKLINKIDSSIEKYNDQKLLIEILKISNQNLNKWLKSTKVVDYLKQIQMKTFEELKNDKFEIESSFSKNNCL